MSEKMKPYVLHTNRVPKRWRPNTPPEFESTVTAGPRRMLAKLSVPRP
ncbi:MAG: hypothetical protein WA996_24870 [Candidatus Promineifilaceae bacterium]